jgi:hypothetical protein
MSYRTFFAFTREPFCSDLDLKDILQTQELLAVKERFDYALRIGAICSLLFGTWEHMAA